MHHKKTRVGNDLFSVFVFGAPVYQTAKTDRVALLADNRPDYLVHRHIVPLTGNAVAETDITALQPIVQLLSQSYPTFGQSAMPAGVLPHLL
jgi:hypothetical protein